MSGRCWGGGVGGRSFGRGRGWRGRLLALDQDEGDLALTNGNGQAIGAAIKGRFDHVVAHRHIRKGEGFTQIRVKGVAMIRVGAGLPPEAIGRFGPVEGDQLLRHVKAVHIHHSPGNEAMPPVRAHPQIRILCCQIAVFSKPYLQMEMWPQSHPLLSG